MQTYTLQQLQQLGAKPLPGESFTADQIRQMGAKPIEKASPEKKRTVLGKVAEFVVPTATRTFGKLREGEDLTARDVIGSTLEVGSFFLPVGAAARGLGLVGKGALTLGRRLALGAAAGATTGAIYEAGRTIGQEGTGALDVIEATGRGAALGGAAGFALPAALPAARGVAQGVRAIPRVAQSTITTARTIGRGAQTGARAIVGTGEEAVTTLGRRVPEKIGQFVEQRAIQKARIAGKPLHIKEAVEKGIEQPIIDFVRKANTQDKLQRVKMLDIAKKGTENISFRGQAKQLPGRTIVKGPIAHLIKTKDAAVNQTKSVLGKLGNKPQNARNIFDQFVGDMAEAGVVPVEGKLVPMRGSRIAKGDLKFYQEVFDDIRPEKGGKVPLTYQHMHQLRQKWFDVARADKTFTTGPTGYARHMRGLLTQEIDKAAKGKYIAAQNTTREALEGLQEYVRLTGYKGKLEDITTKDLKAGEVFMRVFGNAADRPTSVLEKVYATARKYGYKGKENIFDQLRFADILEDIYGSPTRALRGQVGRGAQDALLGRAGIAAAAREALKWSPYSAAIKLVRGALAGTGDDVLKAFENLIRAEAGQKVILPKGASTLGGLIQQTKKASEPLLKEGRSVFGRPTAK